MSHVSECIALYRHDLFVTNEQYGKMIADAHERDLDAEALAEQPEPDDQDASLAFPFSPPFANMLTSAATAEQWTSRVRQLHPPTGWQRNGEQPDEPLTPEQAARYLLEQHEQSVATVESIGEAIRLMDELDDKRAKDIARLTDAVEFLGDRMNLRAEECSALGRRIDNVALAVRTVMGRDAV